MRIFSLKLMALVATAVLLAQPVLAADEPAAKAKPSTAAGSAAAVDTKLLNETVEKAIAYFAKNQAEDGSWSRVSGPGITSVVVTGLLKNGRSPDDPMVARSLKWLEGFAQKDGGIYAPGGNYRNYETCLAILCFSEANKDGRYKKLLAGADKFIRGEQWDEGEGKDKSDFSYGGAGYGSKKRPDLSNTQFLIDALKAGGASGDDQAMQRALIFVSRCQNLESEHNTSPHAAKNPDGGFYYTVAAGGSSPAGEEDNGGLRSYAAMTYAGLKSMLYAGVGPDDQRVKAAMKWLQKNYRLDQNPGMGNAGLYYYYHTFAKTLDAMGQDTFTDDKGEKHNWRQDLVAELAKRQRDDGSWLNENTRWLESDPNLVSGYALMALGYCQPKAAK